MPSLPTVLTLLTTTTLLTSALPTLNPCNQTLTNFLLVTTAQSTPTQNSSLLSNVSATSLFDPLDQQNFLLRLIGPGYLSLPTFNLSNSQLHSLSEGPEGLGEFVYNSTTVEAGQQLQFFPQIEAGGNLVLQDGYLLTVGGEAVGWSICPGPEDEQVIVWKGNSSCVDTYIQAVAKAPY